MKHILNEIKSQLFDAPNEVKSSFNKVVKYFSDWDQIRDLVKGQLPKGVKSIQKVKGSETKNSYKVRITYNSGKTSEVEIPITKAGDALSNFSTASKINVDNTVRGSLKKGAEKRLANKYKDAGLDEKTITLSDGSVELIDPKWEDFFSLEKYFRKYSQDEKMLYKLWKAIKNGDWDTSPYSKEVVALALQPVIPPLAWKLQSRIKKDLGWWPDVILSDNIRMPSDMDKVRKLCSNKPIKFKNSPDQLDTEVPMDWLYEDAPHRYEDPSGNDEKFNYAGSYGGATFYKKLKDVLDFNNSELKDTAEFVDRVSEFDNGHNHDELMHEIRKHVDRVVSNRNGGGSEAPGADRNELKEVLDSFKYEYER